MRGIWIFCLAVCVDLISFTALTYGGTLLKTHRESFHGFANFLREWTEAVLRSTAIFAVSALTKDADRSVFKRWVITHCFLGPLFGTGRMVFLESYPLDKFKTWFVSAGAAAAACFFWEMTFADNENSNGEEKKQKSRQLLMRVICLYRPDILLLIGAFTFLTLAVICETFIPFYTGRVIDILGSQYKWNEFQSAIFFTGIFSLGSSISAGCRGGLFLCAISSFICRVKVKLFGSLVKQDISFFERIKTGDITSRLSTDTNLMARSVALNINVLLRTFIKTLGMLSLMLGLSWKLTLLMLMETPVTGLLQGIYDSHYQRLSKEVQDSIARANETAGEAVSGIRTVRSFSKEQSEARRYDQRLMDTHKLKTHRDTVRAVYLLVRRLAEVGMKVAMLYYGRLFIQSGQMSTGNLVSFILYQSDLGHNIRTLIYIFGDMLNSVGAAGKVFEYLDRKPHVSMDGTIQPDTLKGHIIFQDVTFSYPTRPDHTVLEHFSLELKPGEMTALVGQSGGGKSTCVSLLERFYHPQHGQILLDGQPLQNYQHSYLHSKVAMVGQEPVLFSGTIRDNIAYGLRDCPLKQVQDVARKVNAHGFISQLEKGYDTDVGEQGGLLSGGEKQRIAIARALIREPRVLILDEVTSCLDSESENMVQQTLAGCPNQTLLVIAHRLKTIEKANQIVFINNGEVLEQGTHDELMSKQGTYYKWRNMVFTNDSATTQ